MIRTVHVFEKAEDEEINKNLRIDYIQKMLSSCAKLIEKNKKYTLEIKNAPLTFREIYKIENEHSTDRNGMFYFQGEWYNIANFEKLIQENYEKIVIEIEKIKGE